MPKQAISKAKAYTGQIKAKDITLMLLIKGNDLNATAGTCEEMLIRALCARELRVTIVMHDYLTARFTANTRFTTARFTANTRLTHY